MTASNPLEPLPPPRSSASPTWSFDPLRAAVGVLRGQLEARPAGSCKTWFLASGRHIGVLAGDLGISDEYAAELGVGATVEVFRMVGGAAILSDAEMRIKSLARDDLLALSADTGASPLDAARAIVALDQRRLDEWALAEPRRTADGVASVTSNCAPSRAALVANDPRASPRAQEQTREKVLERDFEPELNLLAAFIRTTLAARLERSYSWQRRVHGAAQRAYWHAAARLGRERLDDACDDGHGRDKLLRVCVATGHLFRARTNSRFHPDLPKEPVQIAVRDNHVALELGSLLPADSPTASVRRRRVIARCTSCGELFDGAGRDLCGRCGSGAGRQARLRAGRARP